MTLRVRTVEIGDPGDLIAHLPEPTGLVWVRDGEGFVGWGEAARLDPGVGPTRFARAATTLGALVDEADVSDEVGLPGTGLVAFATVAFDPRRRGSTLVVPRVLLGRRHGRCWLTVAGSSSADLDAAAATVRAGAEPPPRTSEKQRIRYAGASLGDVAWLDAVAAAVTAIGEGAYEKVVLARDLLVWSHSPFDQRVLTRRLATRFPECHTFAVDGLVGATPELLVRVTDRQVESLVLAGSAARGSDPTADAAAGTALLESKKDRSEHEPAVASVTDVLEPHCLDLTVDAEPWLLRLANVAHLATGIRGLLRDDATNRFAALELAGELHPTAAVCGTPRENALAAIRALEQLDRARYAGPVGWVDARGDGEFGIALRCAELDGARARLFAGGGVVADSLPEDELEETRLKFRAMQSALS